jgi:hypothetical protein
MSLIINITVPDGIVFAADSRQSYINQKNVTRIGSETAEKIMLINDKMCIGMAGLAFLENNGVMKSLNRIVDEFLNEMNEDIEQEIEKNNLSGIAKMIHFYFNTIWKEQQKSIETRFELDLKKQNCTNIEISRNLTQSTFKFIDKSGFEQNVSNFINPINLIFAGINKDSSYETYGIDVPGDFKPLPLISSKDKSKEYGISWIGQTDVVARIILGWDPRISTLPFINEQLQLGKSNEINNQLLNLTYNINWGMMSLQDAIDFSRLMIETTSAIQKFSDGTKSDPGDVPGVGGPIDILVLKPTGTIWINRKEIH